MIYLDYAATTPTNEQVLDTYVKCSKDFIGNPNSLHRLGVEAKEMILESTKQIARLLGINENEIIYTSGATEANNMAIKGIATRYQNRGKHIITTMLEHSSIVAPLQYLQSLGFEVDFVSLNADGKVDLDHLKSLMRDTTILVSIVYVNSETGVIQPLKAISSIVREYPKCFLHTDITQAVGKIDVPLQYVDLASFSAHKFYGPKGVGVLVKKDSIEIDAILHGGKSTSIYRSGTPALPLIVSMAKALRIIEEKKAQNLKQVEIWNQKIRAYVAKLDGITVNSPKDALPHILSLSVLGVKPETMLHALEAHDIFISTQSACAKGGESKAVYAITGSHEKASSSIRISLSHMTTEEEIDTFLSILETCYQELNIRGEMHEGN